MKIVKKLLPRLLLLVVLILLIVAFWSTFMTYLVGPIASVIWLFWRVLTSVNQGVYWFLIICLYIILLLQLILQVWLKQNANDKYPEQVAQ
jgi:hypothetical protein